MSKKEIRQRMKLLAGTLAPGGEPARLWARLETMPEFAAARTVLLYMALPDEVPTESFIKRWYPEKHIVLPLVNADRLELKEYAPEALVHGYAGILEPLAGQNTVRAEDIDFAIIPGQAFDRQCNRLGRGKGFYDKLLPALKCTKAGVAYDFRIVEQLPCDPWDSALDAVITPSETILRDPQQ